MTIQLLTFYAFAFIAVCAAVMVVIGNNSVRSALYLVLSFFACAGLWMLAQSEFLSLVLILVYVGAVMTLFLFVIMMLNIEDEGRKRRFVQYLPLGLLIVGLLVFLMLQAIKPESFNLEYLATVTPVQANVNNIKSLGDVLYTDYAFAFEIAGMLLLVAIIAAISLSHRGPRNCKTQKPQMQVRVKRNERVRIVSMKAEKN